MTASPAASDETVAIEPVETWLARITTAERAGDLLQAYDNAVRAIAEHPGDAEFQYRAALALARAGATSEAWSRLAQWHRLEDEHLRFASLRARLLKDEAIAAAPDRRAGLARRAAEAYEGLARSAHQTYHAVNAATLFLLAGVSERARALATEVLCTLDAGGGEQDPFYRDATRAEAALVLGWRHVAVDAIAHAAAGRPERSQAAGTRRQLRLLCAAQGIDDSLLAPLAPPSVCHFVGHMIAPPGEPGRFLAATEAQVAAGIARCLDAHPIAVGYGSLACGADILWAEALLARGAEVQVLLPCSVDDFRSVSVERGGPGWGERFDRCLKAATRVVFATQDRHGGEDLLFTYASELAMGLAIGRARILEAEVVQLAVWDGQHTDGVAGTAVDVARWRSAGRRTIVVACPGGRVPNEPAPATPPERPKREIRAMLFGDVKGFSKLPEALVPSFVTDVLGAIARVLDRHGTAVLARNTWGDGLYFVVDRVSTAARLALDVQHAVNRLDRRAIGLPGDLAIRLGAHLGPVYRLRDPILGVESYSGVHVTRAARIEPITPEGSIYVTEPFAAALALDPTPGISCDYVGTVALAKGYGSLPLYLLRETWAESLQPAGAAG